jgi:transcriptional regulator with XRE-family HTH domain
MKPNLKKEHAKLLFTQEKLSQKEIAERVNVSEQTITKWVNANNGEWRRLRQNLIVTKKEQLSRIYEQLDEITEEVQKREKGKRYVNSKEADILVKLTAAAKNLETETSLAEIIEVGMRFLNWMRPVDLEKAKEFSGYFDGFIKDQLKK